jgi:hypothetical protein
MKAAPAVLRSSILSHIQRVALSSGFDPMALMKKAGISRRQLENAEVTVPVRAVVEVLEIVARQSGLDDFGLRVGEARGVPDLGPAIALIPPA